MKKLSESLSSKISSDIVADEENDIVLTLEEQLEDVGVINSDNKFNLNR